MSDVNRRTICHTFASDRRQGGGGAAGGTGGPSADPTVNDGGNGGFGNAGNPGHTGCVAGPQAAAPSEVGPLATTGDVSLPGVARWAEEVLQP